MPITSPHIPSYTGLTIKGLGLLPRPLDYTLSQRLERAQKRLYKLQLKNLSPTTNAKILLNAVKCGNAAATTILLKKHPHKDGCKVEIPKLSCTCCTNHAALCICGHPWKSHGYSNGMCFGLGCMVPEHHFIMLETLQAKIKSLAVDLDDMLEEVSLDGCQNEDEDDDPPETDYEDDDLPLVDYDGDDDGI